MKKWIERFSHRFESLTCREKLLLLAFASILTLFWLSACMKQTKVLSQNWKLVNSKIKNYRFWLGNKVVVQKNLDKILEVMDPEKTFSDASFAGEVENIVRCYNMNYSMTSPHTHHGEIFDAHTLQLRCENAAVQDLISLEKAIYAKKPYLTIEKIKIHTNLFNPELLEADCTLSALQLKDVVHEK